MSTHTLTFALRSVLVVMGCLLASLSHAQQKPGGLPGNYPNKPIKFVVGVAPGGGLDFAARPVAQKLSEKWDIPVIVENRPAGAGSVLSMDYTAKAPPDGYTLLVASATTFLEAVLVQKVAYDVQKTFTPVAQFTRAPFVMAIPLSLPANSVREFIAYARSKPGELNFASSGIGSSGHLAGELLKYSSGINMLHIPYKGIGPGIVDMLGGRIQMLFGTPTAVIPHVKAGKIKALAVTSGKRVTPLPDLPAIAETLPEFEFITWFGLLTQEGTPQAIILALNRDINQSLALPEVQKLLGTDGSETAASTPEQFRAVFSRGINSAVNLVKETGIKLD